MKVSTFGPFRLDQDSYSLTERVPGAADQPVPLRPKAFEVLRHLVDNAGRTISHDEFLSELWSETYVQPEVLKGHILAVRTALDDRSSSARYIETVRGRGYRFVAEVRQLWEDGGPETAEDASNLLVGREDARDELGSALNRARSSEMQIVFIAGEAGIGKTALAESFVKEAAADGVMVVTGHCLPGSGATDAYYPVLEILQVLSRGSFRVELMALLTQFAPTWLVQLPGLPKGSHSDLRHDVIDATPHRMARELCDVFDALAHNTSLLILFEDLHWADQATLDLIHGVASRRPRSKLMIVATLRTSVTTDVGRAAITLAQRLALYRLALEIRLEPLSFADIAAFLYGLAQAPSPDTLSLHLLVRSEGNPLFMRAMLDVLLQRGLVSWDYEGWWLGADFDPLELYAPPSLAQIIEAEIQELPLETQSILEAASISDEPFSPFVHHVASTSDERTFEAICETLCRRGQLIRRNKLVHLPGGRSVQTYGFQHALFQEVAYDRQGVVRRACAHAAVAQHMVDIFAVDLTAVASSLARHFFQASAWADTIRFLRISARTAMQRFAHREAIALLEQAIALNRNLPPIERGPTELGLLEELARIYIGIFDPRATATYERLSRLAQDLGYADAEARALFGLGYVVSWRDSDRSLDIMSQALSKSAEIADPVQRARVRCSAHGWRSWIQGWNAADAEGLRAALEELGDLGDPVAFHSSLIDHSLILFPAARYVEAIDDMDRGFAFLVAHGQEAGVDLSLPLWMTRLGTPWAQMSAGRFGEALDGFTTGFAAFKANGDLGRGAALRVHHAFVHERLHDHRAALDMLDETVALIRDSGAELSWNEARIELVVRGLAELGLGQIEAALVHLTAAETKMLARNTLTGWYWRLAVQWGLTDVHLAAGDLATAETSARRFLEWSHDSEERSWRGLAAESCARVALAHGDGVAARNYLSLAWSEIEGYDAPLVRWRLYSVEACLADIDGEPESEAMHRRSRANALEALAATLPIDHPGRNTLLRAQPFIATRL